MAQDSSHRQAPPLQVVPHVSLAGDRLGWVGWSGCLVIMAGILVAEPEAADVLRRLIPRR